MTYPDLRWLIRFNSYPINADRYLIGGRGLLGSLEKGIGGCALLPQLDRGPPRPNAVDCSKLSAWLAEPRDVSKTPSLSTG